MADVGNATPEQSSDELSSLMKQHAEVKMQKQSVAKMKDAKGDKKAQFENDEDDITEEDIAREEAKKEAISKSGGYSARAVRTILFQYLIIAASLAILAILVIKGGPAFFVVLQKMIASAFIPN